MTKDVRSAAQRSADARVRYTPRERLRREEQRLQKRMAEAATKQRDRAELTDKYVIEVLVRGSRLKAHQIPPELVEMKRTQLFIQQQLKEFKRWQVEHQQLLGTPEE